MASAQDISDMLTVTEVAELFHVHPNTPRRWTDNGKIGAYLITALCDRRFKREETGHFLAESNGHDDDRQGAK